LRLIIGFDDAVSRWVGDQLGIDDFGQCVAVGIADDKKLIAGAVYNNYRHPNIEITFASITPRWCSRGVMQAIFGYPFNQVNCTRLTAVTQNTNQPVAAFLCHLGFVKEGVMRRAFRTGEDAAIFGLLKEECRWLKAGEIRHVEKRD